MSADFDVLYMHNELNVLLSRLGRYDGASVARYLRKLAAAADTTSPWQPIAEAPKDGTVILFQQDFPQKDGTVHVSTSTCFWNDQGWRVDRPRWELAVPGSHSEDDTVHPDRWMHVPDGKH